MSRVYSEKGTEPLVGRNLVYLSLRLHCTEHLKIVSRKGGWNVSC